MTTPTWNNPEEDPFTPLSSNEPQEEPYTLQKLFEDYDSSSAGQSAEHPDGAPGRRPHQNAPATDFYPEDDDEHQHRHHPGCWPDPGDPELPPDCDTYTAVASLISQLITLQSAIRQLHDEPMIAYEHQTALVARIQMGHSDIFNAVRHLDHASDDHPAILVADEYREQYEETQAHIFDISQRHSRRMEERQSQGLETYCSHEQIPHAIAIIYDTFAVHSATQAMEWAQDRIASSEDPNWINAYRYVLFNSYHLAKTHHQRLVNNPHYPGISDHEHELVEHAAVDFQRIHSRALQNFNLETPAHISENIAAASAEMAEQARSILIEPIGFDYGLLSGSDFDDNTEQPEPPESCIPYLAFFHNGVRYIQPIADPFPRSFESSLATKYLIEIARSFSCDDLPTQVYVRSLASHRAQMAQAGIHAVHPSHLRNFAHRALNMGISDTSLYELITDLTSDQGTAAQILANSCSMQPPFVTTQQAQTVINAARSVDLDESTIANIASAMYQNDFDALGIDLTPVTARHKRRLISLAERIGFDEHALDSLASALDNTYY